MTSDALAIACRLFSEAWPDFKYRKSQRAWVKKTRDEVLLLCQLQRSRWGAMFYLNFGVYFIGLAATASSSSRLPIPSDWHLYARFENFQKLSTDEHNNLFSLEENDLSSLEARCTKIAKFSADVILSRLRAVGDYEFLCRGLSREGSDAIFEPFNTNMVSKQDILDYIEKKFAMDARVDPRHCGAILRDAPATRVKRDTRA